MSDDELNDFPADNTRQKHNNLGRQKFTPVADRMRRNQSGSREEVNSEPVRSSPRSPGRQRKNQSTKTGGSPGSKTKTSKDKLYPDLSKQKLYPNVSGNEEDSEKEFSENDGGTDEDAEEQTDFVDNRRDQYGRRRVTRTVDDYSNKKSGPDGYPDTSRTRYQWREPNRHDHSSRTADDSYAQSESAGFSNILLIVAILAIVFGFMMYLKQEPTNDKLQSEPPVIDYYKLYKSHLEQMKVKYPSQSTRFWRVVSSSIKRLLTEKEETYPAVLLFGIPEDGSATGTCISKDIIKSLNGLFNGMEDGYINSGNLSTEDEGKMKLDLDERLIRNLDNGKGVVLDHIEKLPAKTALLLHGYCDGDNAPFKSVAIVLGLHIDKTKQLKDKDEFIEGVLNDLWENDLGVDEMPALRSRIANSATVVNPELNVKC